MLRQLLRTSASHAPAAERALARRALLARRSLSTQDKTRAEGAADGEPPAAAAAGAAAGGNGKAASAAGGQSLAGLLAEKEAKIGELNDRTLRVLAEMENVRAIARRDVENAKKYGIVSFAKGLLGVADNLGLALQAVPAERAGAPDADPLLSGLYSGVRATETELLKVFAQHGLERYGAVGDAFDPERHQALYEAPPGEHAPGAVVAIQKPGYAIGDRILRPAEVGVGKAR